MRLAWQPHGVSKVHFNESIESDNIILGKVNFTIDGGRR